MDWYYFPPSTEQIFKIMVFDDGNQVYETYENKWLMFGKWRGKRALQHFANPAIKINSISRWKIIKIDTVPQTQ
jgi:hypothetical protein